MYEFYLFSISNLIILVVVFIYLITRKKDTIIHVLLILFSISLLYFTIVPHDYIEGSSNEQEIKNRIVLLFEFAIQEPVDALFGLFLLRVSDTLSAAQNSLLCLSVEASLELFSHSDDSLHKSDPHDADQKDTLVQDDPNAALSVEYL